MEFQILESAEFLPNGCTLCHTHEGPFVWLPGVHFYDVPTADGRQTIEGAIAFCVGYTDENDPHKSQLGCARLVGTLAGCITPGEAEGLKTMARAALDRSEELHNELESTKAELLLAQAQQVRVVPIEDLRKELLDEAPDAPSAA